MNGAAQQQTVGVLVLAALTIGFVGAYALLYPGTTGGTLALGALIAIAGSVGTHYFNAQSQNFLGSQLQAQRVGFVQAMSSSPPMTSTTSPPPPAPPSSAATTAPTFPTIPTIPPTT